MKSRFKIQSTLSKALFFVLLAFVPYIGVAQCPKAIVCDNLGLGLQYDALPSNFNSANAYFDFGVGDGRNGYYSAEVYGNDPALRNTLYYSIPNCSSGLSNLKITFNDANHTYCGPINSCYDHVFYQNGIFYKELLDNFLKPDLESCKEWDGDCGLNGTIYRTGKVSIGSDYTHKEYMLAVSGNILTEQYKVQKCGSVWCDYVFEEDYKLLPLTELEKSIKENKHLPKTKSAEEIKKEGGIDAAEVLLNHQEKIEEIFLHSIDLDKQLNVSINNDTNANVYKATRANISTPSFLTVNTATSQPETCSSKGSVSIIPSGGTLPYTYQWSTGSTESILKNLDAGTYSGTVTDALGYTITKNIVVENQCTCDNLSAITTIEPATCNTLGKISTTVFGGTFPYSYQWSTGFRGSSQQNLQASSNYAYAVTITDAVGCSIVKSNLIVENICPNTVCFNSVYFLTHKVADPNIPNSVTSQTLFADIRYDLTSTLDLSIHWSVLTPGMTTDPSPTITRVRLGPGSNNIQLTICGFASTGPPLSISTMRIKAAFFLVPNNPFTLRQYDFVNGSCINPTGCCIGKTRPPCNLAVNTIVQAGSCFKNAIIEATASGGLEPYKYRWSTGETTSRVDVPEGSYDVTVTDASGYCTITKTVAIADPCPLDCPKYIDNCYEEWTQFVLKNYAPARCKQWETECDTKSDIRRDGKVAIGPNLTSVPDGFGLAVQGGVITNDVKVKLCNGSGERWCDYVFDKTYKLMPLADVSKYIRQNKRLPNMPSTADIDKENGYEIKKLTLLQQEKIEEAYLHLIKLDEKVKNLTHNVEIKRQRNNKIAHQLKIENEK